jgi:ankyrin repeat protein
LKSRQVKGSCDRPSTPLAQASTRSDPTAVQILLSHGAEIDPEAIFYAIGIRFQRNGTATMEALIDQGANVNYVSKRWYTPLHHAVYRGNLEKVRLLLERGADPDIKALGGRRSAFESAKTRGRMEMCDLMDVMRSKGGI